MGDPFLERWLEAVLETPGLTGVSAPTEARRVLLDDALRAAATVGAARGTVIDVGSGGGSPGIPLAVALSSRPFTLLEAERRKCDFLVRMTEELQNVTVVWGRAEEQATDRFGVALAKALAKPPVAAELCLPLVRPDGIAVIWVGPSAEPEPVARVAARLNAEVRDHQEGLLVLRKLGPTPPGFPRRAGMAKKRPLA